MRAEAPGVSLAEPGSVLRLVRWWFRGRLCNRTVQRAGSGADWEIIAASREAAWEAG